MLERFLASRIELTTEFTLGTVTTACGTVLATEVDDLQMQIIPNRFGKQTLQVLFGLLDMPAVGQPPALGQAMNMRIDGKSGVAERLRHHDTGRFVAHARQ